MIPSREAPRTDAQWDWLGHSDRLMGPHIHKNRDASKGKVLIKSFFMIADTFQVSDAAGSNGAKDD
jgi:hypothetical protein